MSFPVDLLSYVTRFQWDKARYPTTLPLSSLTELINKVQTHGKNCEQHASPIVAARVMYQIDITGKT